METLIQTTFLILLFFAVINLATSAGLYALQRRSTFAWMSVFWFTVILNFVIQGQAQEGQLFIIMAYGFAVIPLNLLGYVSLEFLNLKYPVKTMISTSALAIASTVFLDKFDLPFVWHAMPLAIATAAPLTYTAYIFLIKHRKTSSAVMKLESIVLLAQAIHCFNFAIFREDPSAQLWGWTLSYALYQLLACVLPSLVLEAYHRDENIRLNKLVEQRTAELSKATQDLTIALEQKNMMVRVLTHDISNCLIPLNFFAKTISGKQISSITQEDFDRAMTRIEVSSGRISSMVNQVRDYESMSSRKDNSRLKYVHLGNCLRDSLVQFKESLDGKKLTLTIEFDPNVDKDVKVLVDAPSFVNSVLSNLISNGIKFSHPEGRIEILVKPVSPEMVEILFKDSGVGMPEEMLPKVFSFTHNTSRDGTKGEKGTGFGLPILKKYIEIYEGDISVTSQEQTSSAPGFTCFRIALKSQI